MSKFLNSIWPWIFGGICLGALIVWAFSLFTGITGNIDCQYAAEQHRECTGYNLLFVGLWQIVETTRWLSEAIVALATIAVAVFTWTLYQATTEQGRLTEKSIRLARDEFLASHRPKIIIHTLEHPADAEGVGVEKIAAYVTAFNKGRTATTEALISAAIVSSFGDPAPGIPLQLIETKGVTNPGTPISFRVDSAFDAQMEGMSDLDTVLERRPRARSGIFCIGVIAYTDARGAYRQTGFCRRWSNYEWERVPDSSYEYAY